jgi:beta-lactamase class A
VIAMPAADLPPQTLGAVDRPAILAPARNETSFGGLVVQIPPGTGRVVVRVNGEAIRDRSATGSIERFTLPLAGRDLRIKVTAHDGDDGRTSDVVEPVVGLPRAGRPTGTVPQLDPTLQRRLRRLADGFPGTTAFYVMNLRTGLGAGRNAKARFPAASTVKLGIAIEVMRRLRRIPSESSWLGRKLRNMLVRSTNKAANDLLEWLEGSQTEGAAAVTRMFHRVGLLDTYMYGGYILGTRSARPIPVNAVSQPSFSGRYTSAYDLARLLRYIHSAQARRGPLITDLKGFRPAEARRLMFHLANSRTNGRLDRFIGDEVSALPHKAGWIDDARHDVGVVYWPDGAFVIAVLTWNGSGVTVREPSVLQGRMAETSLERYRALARAARRSAGPRTTVS